MNTNTAHPGWYSFTDEGTAVLRCAECQTCIDPGGATADHHPGVCPHCGVECVYLNWKGRTVQIVMKRAPAVIAQGIQLAQQHFDELEYMEFITALEQLMDDLYAAGVSKHCD